MAKNLFNEFKFTAAINLMSQRERHVEQYRWWRMGEGAFNVTTMCLVASQASIKADVMELVRSKLRAPAVLDLRTCCVVALKNPCPCSA